MESFQYFCKMYCIFSIFFLLFIWHNPPWVVIVNGFVFISSHIFIMHLTITNPFDFIFCLFLFCYALKIKVKNVIDQIMRGRQWKNGGISEKIFFSFEESENESNQTIKTCIVYIARKFIINEMKIQFPILFNFYSHCVYAHHLSSDENSTTTATGKNFSFFLCTRKEKYFVCRHIQPNEKWFEHSRKRMEE